MTRMTWEGWSEGGLWAIAEETQNCGETGFSNDGGMIPECQLPSSVLNSSQTQLGPAIFLHQNPPEVPSSFMAYVSLATIPLADQHHSGQGLELGRAWESLGECCPLVLPWGPGVCFLLDHSVRPSTPVQAPLGSVPRAALCMDIFQQGHLPGEHPRWSWGQLCVLFLPQIHPLCYLGRLRWPRALADSSCLLSDH